MRIYMQSQPDQERVTRYYQLILQEDLIEGWSLLVESGEQGRAGRVRKEHFVDRESAMDKLLSLRDTQVRRGYRVMFMQGDSL